MHAAGYVYDADDALESTRECEPAEHDLGQRSCIQYIGFPSFVCACSVSPVQLLQDAQTGRMLTQCL